GGRNRAAQSKLAATYLAAAVAQFVFVKWHPQKITARLCLVTFLEPAEEVDGDRQERRGVMFARNLAHRLEKAQLQSDRLLADHGGGLDHFFGSLEFAFGIDDFGA